MTHPPLILIAALGRNRVIGRNGTLPWHLPEDLKLFRTRTLGTTVLVGRRTFESLERPLDDRRMVVLSHSPIPGVETFDSFGRAMQSLAKERVVHIIGGANVFEQSLPYASGLVLSLVDAAPEGDAFFPPYEHLIGTLFGEKKRKAYEGFEVVEYGMKGSG